MPKKRKVTTEAKVVEVVDVKEEEEEGKGDLLEVLGSVVKIFCTTTKPNYRMPWQMESQTSHSGSGCLLEGRIILTNAHVATHGTTFMLLKHGGDPKRYMARLISCGHDYDLALLQVIEEDADEFWSGVTPLKWLDTLPPLHSTVIILGYPTNVDSVSVTEGVVSRIMTSIYAHSQLELLHMQVDAAINPGNSGGPAIIDGKLVGVVSEVHFGAQNIGFVVPIAIIQHFFKQFHNFLKIANDTDEDEKMGGDGERKKGGRFPGICETGLTWLNCDNASLRSFHQLTKQDHGVAISNVLPLSVCAGKLSVGDVLMSIDNAGIADDGTIELRSSGDRVSLSYAFSKKYAGDQCQLKFKRQGKMMSTNVTLSDLVPRINVSRPSDKPQYIVWAGLVFLSCSTYYLEEEFPAPGILGELGGLDKDKMPLRLQQAWYMQEKKFHDQEVVILSQVLADELTVGYAHYYDRVVENVNGTPIRNMRQLYDLLFTIDPAITTFVNIALDGNAKIILDTNKAIKSHQTILKRNHILPPYVLDQQ